MNSCSSQQADRLDTLTRAGVRILDARQTFIDDDVDLSRIHPSVTLYPGVRLCGNRTIVCPEAVLGREGPVVVINSAIGPGAAIASGFLEDAVVLHRASIGANSHLRAGCLLEEEVKTAHCVGLKQSILLSFVTLGSLINFCDVLMAGGTSRKDHSEVGSGYIHFNFTPWGKHGGKATPSLCGDVTSGVLLRSPRIFLGGSGGLVGPRSVGYGSVAAAGQVVREDVPANRLVLQPPLGIDREVATLPAKRIAGLRKRNIEYLAQLHTLRVWYQTVRLQRARRQQEFEVTLAESAIRNLGYCIEERITHLATLLAENGCESLAVSPIDEGRSPVHQLPLDRDPSASHIQWVKALSSEETEAAGRWLHSVTETYRHSMR